MDYVGLIVVTAAFVAFLFVVYAIGVGGSMNVRDREALRQAEIERRGEAALEVLRELGRKYPRPKDY